MKRYLGYFVLILIALLCSNTLSAQTCYLFIGSYNFSKNKKGIYIYRFDTANGTLTKVSATRGIANPSYLAISQNGRYVYACTETQTKYAGSVSSFKFDSKTGMLSFISSQKSGGENPVYAAVDKSGRWLLNANYTEGSVSVYPVDSSGNISPASQVIAYTEGSVNPQRQERAHVHCVAFSPAQDYVFFPDLGADKIRCYSFDRLKSEPLSIPASPFISSVPGSGPRHLVFHPNGRYAYCIEEMSGCVSAYTYSNGRLDSFQRIAAHDKTRDVDFASADIHMSPDARFLYVSNRGHQDNIAIFSIDEVTGTLALIGYQPVSGKHPRNFVIDPTGNFLLVANQVSGNVVVFKRDVETGILSKTGVQIRVRNPSCLQIRRYND